MKFQFHLEASRVMEFVFFPALTAYEKSEKAFGALNYEILNPASVERWESIANQLSGFREKYRRFNFSGYSYFFDLMHYFGVKDLKDEHAYLEKVRALTKKDLTEHLRFFLDHTLDITIPLETNSERFVLEAFQILSASSLDNSDKWKLLAILENPNKIRDEYVAFMEEIIPIFTKYYAEVEYAVSAFARQLEKDLDPNDPVQLETMMKQFLISESLEAVHNSNTIHFYLLGIHDYNFNLLPHNQEMDLVLGINVMDYFLKLTQFQVRNKEERITVFKNLSDKTRYDVLNLIANGDSSTKILAEKLGVTSAAISYHIKQLTNDRLIQFDANHRKNGYRINEKRIKEAINGLFEDLTIT